MPPSAPIAVLLALAGSARAYDRAEIPVTRWPDEYAPYQVLPQEWEARSGLGGPLGIRERGVTLAPAADRAAPPRVVAIVQEALWGDLQDDLETWSQDLARDGFDVLVESAAGGTAAELRAHLQELYAGGLEGALLVGDLPVAWYEVANDYDTYGYAVFPCDLALMDLDGTWADQDGNDIADRHTDGTGDVEPEIWVGRMVVTPTMGDTVPILEAYFARNHAFRIGEILPDGSGLVYVDDDWVYWSGEFEMEVSLGFRDVTRVDDLAVTRSADYLPRLTESYDAIAVFVHSSPEAHYFVYGGSYDLLYWDGIPEESDALFYDLFACSNANFTDYVYMAGVYALQTEAGLLALGSTKTGSMLERAAYYRTLGRGGDFGSAFVAWWASVAPYTIDDIWWYYGLVQIGDPTLRTGYPALGVEPAALDAVADGDAPVELEIEVTLSGHRPAEVTVSADQAWITVDPASAEVRDDPVPFAVTLDPAAAPGGVAEGAITVDAPGAINGPLVVPVSLDNGEPAAICVVPAAIDATAAEDGDPVEIDLIVDNCGGGTLAFTAATDAGWATADPAAGTVVDTPITLTLALDPAGLDAGVHEAVLSLAADGADPVEMPIALDVEAEEGQGGCSGCGSSRTRPGAGLLALAGLLLAARRRARRA